MELSANWKKLKATFTAEPRLDKSFPRPVHESTILKRKQPPPSGPTMGTGPGAEESDMVESVVAGLSNRGLSENVEIGKYVAVDCEMVGVGPDPDRESALARVSIVNFNGEQVYDSFVRPKEIVTDWRTHVSGVSAKNMHEARSFEQVQADVAKIIGGNVLVGHAVRNDLDALLLSHPRRDIRDTARHAPFRMFAGGGSPRLKVLAAEILGLEIQSGAHSSVEDARATMLLFRREKDAFERVHAKRWPAQIHGPQKNNPSRNKKKKRKH